MKGPVQPQPEVKVFSIGPYASRHGEKSRQVEIPVRPSFGPSLWSDFSHDGISISAIRMSQGRLRCQSVPPQKQGVRVPVGNCLVGDIYKVLSR